MLNETEIESSKPLYGVAPAEEIRASVRKDGYLPIAFPLLLWGRVVDGTPYRDEWRFGWSAARRLDAAHIQFERVREALDRAPIANRLNGPVLHDVIGDAEMGIWALDKAIEIASCLSGRFGVEVPFPALVADKRPLIASLRDHYSHIEERVLGKVKQKIDDRAEEAFEYEALVLCRELTDGHDTLGIDAEATILCKTLRTYLYEAWRDLTRREGREDVARLARVPT